LSEFPYSALLSSPVPPGNQPTYNGRQGKPKLLVAEVGAVSELSMETPYEDADEQAHEVPEQDRGELSELPFEANEADAAEQIRDAGYDDEDYR